MTQCSVPEQKHSASTIELTSTVEEILTCKLCILHSLVQAAPKPLEQQHSEPRPQPPARQPHVIKIKPHTCTAGIDFMSLYSSIVTSMRFTGVQTNNV
jgi:hypothetical protein